MRSIQKPLFSTFVLYLFLGVCTFLLRYALPESDILAVSLCYAMLACGLSRLFSPLLFFLPSLFLGKAELMILHGLQAILLGVFFQIHTHLQNERLQKSNLFPLLSLSLALGAFVALSPFSGLSLILPFPVELLTQKVLLAAFAFLLAAVFAVGLRAFLFKALKCRLRGDELIFCILLYLFVGLGVCHFLSVNAYMGISFLLLLLFAYMTKDSDTLLFSFILSLPAFLVGGVSPTRFFFYGVAVTLFIKWGRLPAALILLGSFFAWGYLDGLYALSGVYLAGAILSGVLPCLIFMLLPSSFVKNLENKWIFYREKHLSRVAINRNRAEIGKQLYELSSVFREIECTFYALGETGAEESAKAFIQTQTANELCKQCEKALTCKKKGALKELHTLIDVGCMKGKISLLDMPKKLADECIKQSDLLYLMNRQLAEYRKYMLEAENAASGRALLARQAQAVSEILKNLALEQSEPVCLRTEQERQFYTQLLTVGIVCSEVFIHGEPPTVSIITHGRTDVHKLAAVASHLLQTPMMICEKLSLSQEKYCFILRKKPYFDAAFGVSSVKKDGSITSGDTHSVIKIDETKFMVALSDGMGSGEYAERISQTTISLLESFYRAKMPADCVLSTVNKLLSFGKEESFACVDIGMIDLESGLANIVKLGAPIAFILSGNTIKVLESNSLPLGILEGLRPQTYEQTMQENDILLFISDGISGAFPSSTDLYNALKNIPTGNPQQLTDSLLSAALSAYGNEAKDDMTALAVRLFKSA